VIAVLAVAALVGQLTPIGERLLPESMSPMANSSGSWSMIVIGCIFFSRLTGWRAALLALGAFVLMDLCFYLVFGLLGGTYPRHYVLVWVIVAVVIGPLVGLCASWPRSPVALLQEAAVAAPSAILVGEGVFMLVRLPGSASSTRSRRRSSVLRCSRSSRRSFSAAHHASCSVSR